MIIEALGIAAILTGIISLEQKRTTYSIILLGLLGLIITLLYYLMNAQLISIFQLSITASLMIVLGYLEFGISKEGER